MSISYMARQKKPTTARSIRFLEEIAEAIDVFAEDQLLSSNAAVNRLIRERLTELGYLKPSDRILEQSSDK